MKKLIFVASFLFVGISSFSQNVSKYAFTGQIANADDLIYTVTAALGSDTIRATFAESKFLLPIDTMGVYSLKISSTGYDDYTVDTDVSKNYNLGDITLSKSKTVNLDEVVVQGKRCAIKRDGTTYTISNIEGTYLGDAGSIMDMLQWTPGLRRDGSEGVKTTNGATPVIYINGRKVVSNDELKARSSSEVQKIEVIRDPGARYSSSTAAVVNITLKKHLKDYVGLRLMNDVKVTRRVSDEFDVNLNTQTGKLGTFFSFHYENGNHKAHSDIGTDISATTNYSSLSDYMKQSWKTKKRGYYTVAGISYDFTPKSSLNIQYNGNFINSKKNVYTAHELTESDVKTNYDEYDNKPKDKNTSHTATVGYRLNHGSSHFDINGSWTHINTDIGQNVTLSEMLNGAASGQNVTNINKNDKYDIYSFESNYDFSINKVNKFNVGVSTDYIDNKSIYLKKSAEQSNRRKDLQQGAFLTYSRKFNKFKLNAEFRYEYSNTSLTDESGKQTQSFHNFLPFVRLTYDFNDDSQIMLAYRRMTLLPNLSQMNSIASYSDMLHSETGNPELKSQLFNKVWTSFNYKDFDASLSYYHTGRSIITGTYMQEDSRTILRKPLNVRYEDQILLSLGYNFSGPKYNIYVSFDEAYTTVKYPYIAGLTNEDQSNWHSDIYIDGSWNFYKTFEAYTSLSYLSPFIEGNTKTDDMWGIDLGVKASFFKRKLIVAVEGKDLLHRGITPYWSAKFANVSEWRRNSFDTRSVVLKITYKLNVIPSNYRNKRIGTRANMRAN